MSNKQTCPSRMNGMVNGMGLWKREENLDKWVKGTGWAGWQEQQLSCSFCGSLNPDTFMVELENGAMIVPTDKNYKAYLKLQNGSEAKFYYAHLSVEQKIHFIELYNEHKFGIDYPGYFYVNPFFMVPLTEKELESGN